MTAPPFKSALWNSGKVMETGVLPTRNGVQNGLHAWEPTGPCLVPICGSPCSFSLSDVSSLSLQQFISYSSGLPTTELVPTKDSILVMDSILVSCDSLCSPNLGVAFCSVASLLLWI